MCLCQCEYIYTESESKRDEESEAELAELKESERVDGRAGERASEGSIQVEAEPLRRGRGRGRNRGIDTCIHTQIQICNTLIYAMHESSHTYE